MQSLKDRWSMADEDEFHIKHTPHSEEVVSQIIGMHDDGVRSKDIYKQSKQLFGYSVKQSTISNILRRHGRDPKANTYRRSRRRRRGEE